MSVKRMAEMFEKRAQEIKKDSEKSFVSNPTPASKPPVEEIKKSEPIPQAKPQPSEEEAPKPETCAKQPPQPELSKEPIKQESSEEPPKQEAPEEVKKPSKIQELQGKLQNIPFGPPPTKLPQKPTATNTQDLVELSKPTRKRNLPSSTPDFF